RAAGHRVVTVRESDDYRCLADGDYALAPERGREGYDLLVRDLVAAGGLPRHLVHLWLLTPDEGFRPGSNFFHHTQERGFYSLFFLAQALGERGLTEPLHLLVAGNGLAALDGERLQHPSKATVLGPCRVIPREFPGFTCAVVDLPLPVSGERAAWRGLKGPRLDQLAELVERELSPSPRGALAAWRDGRRYEQVFERIALPAPEAGRTGLRPRGVYLVTGGFGGLGLVVARHLAREAQARLVLVGRSPLPERSAWDFWLRDAAPDDPTARRILAIRELESLGAEVLPAAADVTDVDGMRAVIDEARRRFGGLHGVIHAAGVLKDAPLLAKTHEETERVFAPKVHGTLVLESLLAGEDLDFLLLFSSLSSFVAPAGQVDYVAASCFLDAYARSGRFERGRVVNWGLWSGVGMVADALGSATPRLSGRPPRHPLFDSRAGGRDAAVVLEARYSPGTRWILDEHRSLQRHAVVPGSAFVELAGAALREAGEERAFEIRDLVLLSPLHVPDGETRTVRVELRPDPGGYAFRVASHGGPHEPWDTHAEARLALRALPEAGRLEWAPIEARCGAGRTADGTGLLSAVQQGRMRFGPRWRALREARVGADEVLASLELADGFAADLERYRLHPALLDIALTCGLELPEFRADNGLWVPVSWRSMRVHGPLPARLRAWARRSSAGSDGSDVASFDVAVADESGRILLEVEDLALRRVPAAADFALPRPAAAAPDGQAAGDEGGARPAWSPGRAALERNHARGLTPAEGLAILDRALGPDAPAQLLATSLDLEGLFRQAAALSELPAAAPAAADPAGGDADLDSPDGIERTLAGFWRELLGVRRVGLRDSFFELGGHSLIAVRLFARIKKAFEVDFPISLLFEAPTIERCAATIRRALSDAGRGGAPAGGAAARAPAQETRYRHLVPMHPGQPGDQTPFFLVAGMFGNVLNLRHLANLLGHERRIFGVQALGLYGQELPHETIEEMAAAYLAELRTVAPRGPYVLGGFSGGGITAFEMARQLQAAGERVALLVMLDTYLPRSPPLSASDRARIHWDRMRARGPGYATEWARNRLRWELARIRGDRGGHDAPLPSEFRSESVGAAFRRALTRYELQPLEGRIALFRPKLDIAHVLGPGRVTNSKRMLVYDDNGWGPWCAGVDVHEVPGDHDSMVLEPNVRVLAGRLRRSLQSAEPRPAQPPFLPERLELAPLRDPAAAALRRSGPDGRP
ncbi:MAG TPA: SDR family NAD(P)-dependent oxidoreductase, partial [Planctomycetota bacterium]|nr:SDR family NAD(P)-dependent oxidoreductase [Planctomycetota bacterium]